MCQVEEPCGPSSWCLAAVLFPLGEVILAAFAQAQAAPACLNGGGGVCITGYEDGLHMLPEG